MSDKKNIAGLEVLGCFLILRYYKGSKWFGYKSWGYRNLGFGAGWRYPRVALDCGKLSIIFERYKQY
jgi:hypothetical protein